MGEARMTVRKQRPPLGFQPRSGAAVGMTAKGYYAETGTKQERLDRVLRMTGIVRGICQGCRMDHLELAPIGFGIWPCGP